jgi:hypothetical protein
MLTYENIGIGDDTTGGSGFLISRFGTPMRGIPEEEKSALNENPTKGPFYAAFFTL